MNRRKFLGSTLGIAATYPLVNKSLFALNLAKEDVSLAIPTADQLAWQDLEVGMIVCLAPNTWQDKESDDLSTPLSEINPVDLNTDQWAQCAANLGARYIVFTAKHQGGFCMWQTDTTDYSIGHTPWRGGHGDILQDLSASCQKYNLKLGVYLSPRDDHFGAGVGGRCKDPNRQAAYNSLYRTQLKEVLTRYGQMMEVWFDGSIVVPTSDILRQFAPHAMIFQGPDATIRWVGNEDGFAPYPAWNAVSAADAKTGVSTALHGDLHGDVWLPIEADVSSRRPYWFWSTKNERNLQTLDQLLEVYYRSVGRGVQLLLGLPPDRTGQMPAADFARVREFGDEVRHRFEKSVAETSGKGETLVLSFPKQQRLDHVILQEECRFGQRVYGYRLEGRIGTQWITLGTGSAIGHKRIHPFEPKEMDAVRLLITATLGRPQIRRFAVFDAQASPPQGWNESAQMWAANAVGNWAQSKFKVDLSKKINAAAQYRLRFVPENGHVIAILNDELLLDGVPEPDLVKVESGSSNVLILTMTEIGQRVIIQGTVEGAEQGTILLQKL